MSFGITAVDLWAYTSLFMSVALFALAWELMGDFIAAVIRGVMRGFHIPGLPISGGFNWGELMEQIEERTMDDTYELWGAEDM